MLVRADTQAGRIFIAVLGPPQGRRRALAAIRAELTAIHRTVPGLEATAMVPLPGDPGEVEEYRALTAVSEAEEAAEKGDGPTALERLKAAGQWTLDVATRVGIPVAQKAIQTAMGL